MKKKTNQDLLASTTGQALLQSSDTNFASSSPIEDAPIYVQLTNVNSGKPSLYLFKSFIKSTIFVKIPVE